MKKFSNKETKGIIFDENLRMLNDVTDKMKIKKSLNFKTSFSNKYGFEASDRVKNFEHEISKIQKIHYEIKEETDQYKQFNNKIERRQKFLDKLNNVHRFNQVEKTFSKLIHTYKEKGYKIPNLSIEKNLFKSSPLILENSHLTEHYKYYSTNPNQQEKDQIYINNLNKIITEKTISSSGVDQVQNKMLQRKLSLIAEENKNFAALFVLDEQKIDDENKKLEEENQILRQNIKDKLLLRDDDEIMVRSLSSFNAPRVLQQIDETKKKNKVLVFKKVEPVTNNKQSIIQIASKPKISKVKNMTNNNSISNINSPYVKTTAERNSTIETARETNYSNSKFIDKNESLETQFIKVDYLSTDSGSKRINKFIKNKEKNSESSIKTKSIVTGSKIFSNCGSISPVVDTMTFTKGRITETPKQSTILQTTPNSSFKNKSNFLENYMNNFDLDTFTLPEIKEVVEQYCKNNLNFTEQQAIERMEKKKDPKTLWNQIYEFKGKVEQLNVKELFGPRIKYSETERIQRLDKVNELDNEIKRLNFEYIKRCKAKSEK